MKALLMTVSAAACVVASTQAALAQSGAFTTLTYNVAGLLEPFSGGNPSANTPFISCLIRSYDVVDVQEDFNYHAALYDSCDDHPYRSSTSGGMGIGSGLNTLSYLPYTDFARVSWAACSGVDCLTPKGFTRARVRLAEGVVVDVYNLHAQAETTDAALAARRSNIVQLAAYIEAESAGNAVIVHGDTNTRYTRSGDNIREFVKRGFKDVWVERVRGGNVPESGASALTACEPSANSASCEVVDKVLYRDNGFLGLRATDFRVEDARFVDSAGADLSDHFPLYAAFAYTTRPDRRLSDAWGGPHGQSFNDLALLPATPVVRSLSLRAGARVDRVGVTLTSGYVIEHGGAGGNAGRLDLAADESVIGARFCAGQKDGRTRIFHARFTTNQNRSLQGGTATNDCTTFSAPAGWMIVGFHGRSDAEVDKLGVIYAPRSSVTPGPAQYFQIVNRRSGQCLDISGADATDGANVAQWPCSGADWQRWNYDAATGVIRSQHDPRFCLDNMGSFDDGADVRLWTCNGNANQRFDVDVGQGILRMRTNPVQVLDASDTSNGGEVMMYGDWGGPNQRWHFAP